MVSRSTLGMPRPRMIFGDLIPIFKVTPARFGLPISCFCNIKKKYWMIYVHILYKGLYKECLDAIWLRWPYLHFQVNHRKMTFFIVIPEEWYNIFPSYLYQGLILECIDPSMFDDLDLSFKVITPIYCHCSLVLML